MPTNWKEGRSVAKPDLIVVHHSGEINGVIPTPEEVKGWLIRNGCSAHGIIGWDGRFLPMVAKTDTAYGAAGPDEDGNLISDWNDRGIHYELCGDGNKHLFSDAQYRTLAEQAMSDRAEFGIPLDLDHVVRHSVLTPGKVDPGDLFSFEKLFSLLEVVDMVPNITPGGRNWRNWLQPGQPDDPLIAFDNVVGVCDVVLPKLRETKTRAAQEAADLAELDASIPAW